MAKRFTRVIRASGFLVAVLASMPLSAFCQSTPYPPTVWHAENTAEDSTGAPNETKGTVSYAHGVSGQAFELDGKSQSIQTNLDTNPEIHPSMTWSVWVLPRKIVGRRQILSSDNGNYKRSVLLENDRFAVFTGGTFWETPETVDPGVWQHVAVVFEPGEIRFYKNGLESVHQIPPALPDPVEPLAIGRNPAFGEHFAGLIDEVEIHNRALSPEEISEAYENLRGAAEAIPQENLENASLYDDEAGTLGANTPLNIEEATPEEIEEWHRKERKRTTQEEAHREKEFALAQTHQKARLIALDALESKWDYPQTFSDKPDAWKIEGHRNTGKKDRSSQYLGKVTLLLFLDGEEIQSFILPEAQFLQPEGLEIVVLTPARPKTPERGKKEASVEDGMRLLLPQIPQDATILSDPYGSVRYQLNLFSTPAVLFDKNGRIIWKTRIGQRETPDDTTEFRKVVRLALADKIIEQKASRKMLPIRPQETELFGFENGWEGWKIEGDAWNPPNETIHGPSSERHIPGLVAGFLGRHWLSSFAGKFSEGIGTATSPEFEITAPYLHFLAGGGDIPQNAGITLQILPEGTYVRTFSPDESTYELKPATWDLTPFVGKKARIIAYDSGAKEFRDGIMADAFTLSNFPETPASFAERHEPNNPEHVNRVAADFPETWKELQAGNFYQEFTPTWAFKIERILGAETNRKKPPYRFEHVAIAEKTPIQEASKQKLEVLVDGKPGTNQNIPLENTVYTKEMLTAENRRNGEDIKIKLSAQVTVKEAEFKMGKNSDFTPLTKAQSNAVGTKIPQEAVELFKKENLLRQEGEADHTYILRVWRYIQRYYIGWSDWGGWPTDKTKTETTKIFGGLGQEDPEELWDQLSGLENIGDAWGEWITTKSLDCPAVGIFALLSHLSEIPTIDGQGLWINKEVGGESLGHVRVQVFLEKSGWILLDDDKNVTSQFGQFSEGRKTGDNYFQYVNEIITFPHKGNLWISQEQDFRMPWITKQIDEALPKSEPSLSP